MSRSLKLRADFADAALHVRAADKPIPPMNSESGRSVELLMMLVSVVAASPSDAMPTPDEVQMNCESDSMMFVMSDILLGRGNRLALCFLACKVLPPLDDHIAICGIYLHAITLATELFASDERCSASHATVVCGL